MFNVNNTAGSSQAETGEGETRFSSLLSRIAYIVVINIPTHCKIGGFPNFNQFAALETYYCGI